MIYIYIYNIYIYNIILYNIILYIYTVLKVEMYMYIIYMCVYIYICMYVYIHQGVRINIPMWNIFANL